MVVFIFVIVKTTSENPPTIALGSAIFGSSGALGAICGSKWAPERVSEGLLVGPERLRGQKKIVWEGLGGEKK